METFVDSCTGGTLGYVPMGRGIPAPTPPDRGRNVGALPPVPYACDRSQTGQARLTHVNRAAPHVRPRHINFGGGQLGRYSFKALGSASPSAHSTATWQPSERLGAACSKGLRGATGHPEVPWPLHDRSFSPEVGRGEGQAARPRGQSRASPCPPFLPCRFTHRRRSPAALRPPLAVAPSLTVDAAAFTIPWAIASAIRPAKSTVGARFSPHAGEYHHCRRLRPWFPAAVDHPSLSLSNPSHFVP